VIIKDDPKAEDWYCAEIRKILADRIEVNYYTTITPAITSYKSASEKERYKNIKDIFEDVVLRQGFRVTHDHAAVDRPWENEPFMVGKNSNRRC
jgi:hypothetical protein